MLREFLQAFGLIFLAEMGDKTQMLAMSFATKYSVKKVLLGIMIGSFLNHALAVLLGQGLTKIVPIDTIQIIAGFAFVGFAIWTLRLEDEEDEEEVKFLKYGPTVTVAVAFFIGELGDKTQLQAIAIASQGLYPFIILMGTVTGMMVTGGLGIFIGRKLGEKIPETGIKLLAASIFMYFGVTKLVQKVPKQYLTPVNMSLFIGIISFIVLNQLLMIYKRRQEGIQSAYVLQAKKLHDYFEMMEEHINDICLGTDHCGECMGSHCIVGYTKSIIRNGLEGKLEPEEIIDIKNYYSKKQFSKERVIKSLSVTLEAIKAHSDNENLHIIRKNLEWILFNHCVEEYLDEASYLEKLRMLNSEIVRKL